MDDSSRIPFREQLIIASVTCAGLGVMSGIWLLVVRYLFHQNLVDLSSTAELGWALWVGLSLLAAVLLPLHRDSDKHLHWELDDRLLASSWSTFAIFVMVLGIRLAALSLLLGLQVLLAGLLPDPEYPKYLPYMALPVYVFLFLQTERWLEKRAPWIPYGALIAALAVLGGIRLYQGTLEPLSMDMIFRRFFLHPVTLVTVPPLLMLLIFFGVYLERRNINFWPVRLVERLRITLRRPEATGSDFEAHLQAVMGRIGLRLPLITLFFTVVLVTVIAVFTREPFRSGFGQYLPLAALIIAALTRSRLLFSKTLPAEYEPLDNSALAAALLLAQLRAFFYATVVAGALSFSLLWAGSEERAVLVNSLNLGVTDAPELALALLCPLVAAAFIAWCACWFLLQPVGVLLVVFLCMPSDMFIGQLQSIPVFSISVPVDYADFAVVAAGAPVMLVLCRRKKWISSGQMFRMVVCFLALALLVFLGTGETKGLRHVLFALACASLAVLPVPSVVRAVHKRRPDTDTGIWPNVKTFFRGRYWLYAGLVCFAVAFALFLFGAHRAPVYVRLLQEKNVPASLKDYEACYAAAPDGENSARLYIEAEQQLVPPKKEQEDLLPFYSDMSLSYGQSLNTEEMNALQEFVSSNGTPLALVLQAQQLPFAGYPEDRYIFMTRMDSLGVLTLCAALDAAFDGNVERWHAMITAGLRLHEALEAGDTILDGWSIRTQCRDALRVLEYSLLHLQPTAPMVREWLALLERDRYTNFRPARQAVLNSLPEDMDIMGNVLGRMNDELGTSLLRQMTLEWLQPLFIIRCRLIHDRLEFAEAGSRDVYQAIKAYPDEYSSQDLGFRYMPLVFTSYSHGTNLYHQNALVIARAAAAKAALGTLLYVKDHKSLPETLESLVPEYLSQVPRDPYTPAGNIRYRVSGSQILFYSVGPDEKDDAGTTDDFRYETGDMVFRLPLPQVP